MNFIYKNFDLLSINELYSILQFRTEVFVVEQNCIFQDMDNLDFEAIHLWGIENGEMLCYCRILKPGTTYQKASIGRVISRKKIRGKNYGRKLMKEAIKVLYKNFGEDDIVISAQQYLIKFYEEFGFKTVGNTYLDTGIQHIKMILPKQM